VLLVVVVRPVVRRQLTPKAVQMGIKALEGKKAVVLIGSPATRVGSSSTDRCGRREAMDEGDVYEPGDSVTVLRIDGATAVVFGNG
jgi:membrane protein implicated in regulation of membrane protease activity